MTEAQIVCGDRFETVRLPQNAVTVSPGVSLGLPTTDDLAGVIRHAMDEPLDTPPLRALVKRGDRVTIAFDDATVPCYAPLWSTALPMLVAEVENAGVREEDISLVCANALHRKLTHEELAKLIGHEFVARHSSRLRCHDAEDEAGLQHLGTTASGHDVEISTAVTGSDLTIYLNCSTMRAFSGGWKSICVGLSSYRSIHHHHTPDIMSMSLDRNRMHEILDEMGSVVDAALGTRRIFKLETVLANPLAVHTVFGGTVGATRAAVLETLRAHQPNRRDLVEEPVDTVVYGVPDWSPYAAYSHNNPILDLISTGLGYLGGVIEALGKPGCTVVMATTCRDRWDDVHHASYREVWETVLPQTLDPDEARHEFEPRFARRGDYIERYRHHNSFHPVHGIMALYPLKRLRHAGRVIVAGADDPSIPAHLGFDTTPTVDDAVAEAGDGTVALVEYPPAFNRS
ncbi:MAG: nickel-dependent lactate racemase [Actinobacteria bacterium]|nr:nickel-dependent lactate racemase [Actinomycetota bacterium]